MPERISKAKFERKMLEYLRTVERTGEAIIITDHGRPVVRIEPYREANAILRTLRGSIVRYDDPPAPVGDEEWEAGR